MKIGILGGTGALGSALAVRAAAAGHEVVLGSRVRDKALDTARTLGHAAITGDGNAHAAVRADVIIVAVPFASHDGVLDEIAPLVRGKLVIDAVVPLAPPRVSVVSIPPGGSAGQRAQERLGPDVRVVSAFHNVSAASLRADGALDCDVLVFGDDRDARAATIAFCESMGVRGIDGGVIANSVAGEALTAVLIGINRRYGVKHAGIRITGIAGEHQP